MDKFFSQNEIWKSSSERITENADEGMLVFDPNLRIKVWNSFMESITGKSGDELSGKSITELFPGLDAKELANLLAQKDKALFQQQNNLDMKVLPSYDKNHRLMGGVALIKKHGQKEQPDAVGPTEVFRLVGSLHDLYVLLSPDLIIQAVSHKVLEKVFLDEDQVVGKLYFDFFQGLLYRPGAQEEKNLEALQKMVRQVLTDHQVRDFSEWKIRVRHLQSQQSYEEYFWCQSFVPVLDENRQIQHVLVKIHDLTTRNNLQEGHVENLKRFEQLALVTKDVVWEWNMDKNLLWWNDNFYTFFGFSPEESSPSRDFWREHIHPEDRDRVMQSITHCLQSQERYWSEDYRFANQDGSYCHVLDRGHLIFDKKGKPLRMVGTMVDITNQKNSERILEENIKRFERKNLELEKSNEILDTFVYAAAHDLKSPVNNLKSLMALLKRVNDEEQKKVFLDAIDVSVARLSNTISSLVQIVEVQNSQAISIKEISFKSILEMVMADYQTSLEKVKGIISTDFKACPTVRYNEAYVLSIMMNLVSNAIKYSSDKRRLHIHLSSWREDDFVVLSVKDNGMGIDMERHGKNMFKPFRRFTNKAEGKGIGLHLLRSIVEKNLGKIEVESELDKGTIFKVYLREYD
jgi:PAS domain S-box-containing protein